METELGVLPSGKLVLKLSKEENLAKNNSKWVLAVQNGFDASLGAGLFALGGVPALKFSPSVAYWRDFAGMMMTALCHLPEDTTDDLNTLPTLSPADHARLLLCLPPMQGGEYVDADVLDRHWKEMTSWVSFQLLEQGIFLGDFLKKRAPMWHQVGRICFHLAENKRMPDRPFAFMATYSRGLSTNAKIQYQPLGHALQEYGASKDKQKLIHLLSPVHLASKKSSYVSDLVESGNVYRPMALTPEAAYQFLKDVPLMEESGIVVKLPDWWKKRPRPQVTVTVGNQKSGQFGAESMLDFRVQTLLNGEALSEDDIRQLMEAQEGLMFLKGQWVEVNPDRLKEALEHWKQVEASSTDGLDFIQGMRLLAGVPRDLADRAEWQEEDRAWAQVDAGAWLKDVLAKMQDPSQIGCDLTASGELLATLRPYQETGSQWLTFLSRLGLGACLADDMGLGKTLQVITMLLATRKDRGSKASLLILPASLLGNWKSEITKFAPSLRIQFLHPSERMETGNGNLLQEFQDVDLVITTYGMVTRIPGLKDISWKFVILDEAQAIKNPATKQTRAVKEIKADARIALTGTPIENRLSDMWSLFDFICPGLLGSLAKFKSFVKDLESREKDQYLPLRRLVQPYILRRLKTDKRIIKDLPDKTEMQSFCSLSKQQAVLYAKLVEEMKEALEQLDGIQRRGIILAYLMRFKQLCNHPSQLLGDGKYKPTESGKFFRIEEICQEIVERQEKVLVFTQFREMTEPLAGHLQKIFGRSGLILHGGVNVKSRQALVNEFQNETGPPFFILSLKAGGTGLNLTAANHVIHFDRWWNPAVENQATDRAFRIGQKHPVLVHKFVTKGTLEEKIDDLIQSKKQLAADLLEEGTEKLLTEMSNEELIRMVSLDVNRAPLL